MPKNRKLVLIVDDTPTNVAVISGLLKDAYRTKVATNGEKALAIACPCRKCDPVGEGDESGDLDVRCGTLADFFGRC